MEVAGVITGAIALTISAFLLWNNYLSPFNVKVFCGNPRLEPGEYDLGKGKTVIRFSAILPLYFVNTGARDGAIRDIALIVKSKKNTWLFHPVFYCKYSAQTESVLGEQLTKDPSNEPFYPIHLLGKEKIYKPIVFVSLPSQKFPLGKTPLLPGIYTFQLQTLEFEKKDYETKRIFNVNLTKEHISSLSAANYIIPFVEEVKKKRQELQAE